MLKKTLLWFFGLILLAFVSLAIFLYWKNFTINLNAMRPSVNDTLSNTLNQTVEIRGPLELVLSLKPALLIKDVSISTAQDLSKKFTIQEIKAYIDLSNMSIKEWGQLFSLNAVLPADISISLNNTSLLANGTITYQDDQLKADLAISLKGQHLNDINFFSANPLLDIGPYSIEADLQQQQQSINVQNFIAKFKDTTLNGGFSYDSINQRHLIKANLETPTLVIPQLASPKPVNKTLQIPAAIALLSDIDFELNLKTNTLQYQDSQINDVELELAFKNGRSQNIQIKSNVNNTLVSAMLSLDMQELINKAGTADPAKIDTTIQLSALTHQANLLGVIYYPPDPVSFKFNTTIKGSELNNLSELMATQMPQIKNYAVETLVAGKDNEISFSDLSAKIDETNIVGKISLNNTTDRPFIKADMNIDILTFNDMAATESPPSDNQNTSVFGFFDVLDADININVGKLSSQFVVMNKLSLSGQLKNSQLTPVDFKFNTGKSNYSGKLSVLTDIKTSKKLPKLKLSLAAKDFHLSEIAILTHYWTFFDVQSPKANLNLKSQGDSIDELIRATSIKLNAPTGKFVLIDEIKKTSESWPLKDIKSDITPKSVFASSVVTQRDTPLEYQFTLSRPKVLAFPTEPLDFHLKVLGANSILNVKLPSPLPFDWQQQEYFAELEGKDLSDLNTLFDSKLPILGPYTLNTKLTFPQDGLELTDANATINSTALEGGFLYQIKNGEPTIEATLNSDYVIFNDIMPKNFHLQKSPDVTDNNSGEHKDRPIADVFEKIHNSLGTKNIQINLNLNNIKTEGIELNKVHMKLVTGNEKVELAPIEISYLDGKVSSDIHIYRIDEQLDFKFKTHIENLDYGFLSSYIEDSAADAKGTEGTVSTDIDLVAIAPTYEQLVNNLNGHFNLIIWPDIIGNYLLEVWGEGIFRSTLSAFVPDKNHKFNCIVGYFDIENGNMKSRAFNIDTTRLEIIGSGSIDLKSREINFVVQPLAKIAQALTNDLPMQITGSWEDYKIQPKGGVVKGGIIGSLVRVPTNLITYPYRAFKDISIPKDSRIDCEDIH